MSSPIKLAGRTFLTEGPESSESVRWEIEHSREETLAQMEIFDGNQSCCLVFADDLDDRGPAPDIAKARKFLEAVIDFVKELELLAESQKKGKRK